MQAPPWGVGSSGASAPPPPPPPDLQPPTHNIYILLHGAKWPRRRFELLLSRSKVPSHVRLLEFERSSSPSFRGPAHILVVDGRFIIGARNLESLPTEVRSAVRECVQVGGRVCTDDWFDCFRSAGWKEDSEFSCQDLTGMFREMPGCIKRLEVKASDNGKVEIDLLSDSTEINDDDDDEDDDVIEVVEVKRSAVPMDRFPTSRKRERTAQTVQHERNISPGSSLMEWDQIKQDRRRNRLVQPLASFRATWLLGLDGFKEAKAKAKTSAKEYHQGESPEEVVLAKANDYMQRQRTKGKMGVFVFEQCYDEQCRVERLLSTEAQISESTCGKDDDSSLPVAASNPRKVVRVSSWSWSQVQKRNQMIAKRLLDIFEAESALDEFHRILTDNRAGTVIAKDAEAYASEGPFGKAWDHPVKVRAKQIQNKRDFREMDYKRVARTVETYPVMVTLNSLEHPPPFAGRRSRSGSSDGEKLKLAVPKIKGKVGSSTRDRLIRVIQEADGDHPLLNVDRNYRHDISMLQNPDYKAINELRKIWGVGLTSAARLVSWGIDSVDSLRKDREVFEKLNRQQKIGLARYEDITQRIPRDEVAAIGAYVRTIVSRESRGQVTVTVGGSYRRGAPSSGDVDLIFLPDHSKGAPDDAAINIVNAVLHQLRKDGFLTDDLVLPNQFKENEGPNPGTDSRTYMGVCRLLDRKDRKFRRIDIKAYPGCQGPFALIYFTGDTHFNRSLRHFAKKAGLSLSDAGLASCTRRWVGGQMKRIKADVSVRCLSEEDVFEALGLRYVSPTFRACHRLDRVHRWDDTVQLGGDSDYDSDTD